MTFDDVGAVVYFLRLVVWIVPGFSVERFEDRLRELHDADRAGRALRRPLQSRFLDRGGQAREPNM